MTTLGLRRAGIACTMAVGIATSMILLLAPRATLHAAHVATGCQYGVSDDAMTPWKYLGHPAAFGAGFEWRSPRQSQLYPCVQIRWSDKVLHNAVGIAIAGKTRYDDNKSIDFSTWTMVYSRAGIAGTNADGTVSNVLTGDGYGHFTMGSVIDCWITGPGPGYKP